MTDATDASNNVVGNLELDPVTSPTKTTEKKPFKRLVLQNDLKGFLCTYTFSEKVSVKEAYNLLNYYAGESTTSSEDQSGDKVNDTNNISESIDAELKQLKSASKSSERLFHAINAGAKYVMFIRTSLDDPLTLAYKIIETTASEQRSKYLLRLTPVETTCKASVKSILETIAPLIKKHFDVSVSKTFAIILNKRNCSDALDKMEIITEVAKLVDQCSNKHKVNLKQPDMAIIIDIIRSWCFIGFAPDYYKFKKYNLQELNVK